MGQDPVSMEHVWVSVFDFQLKMCRFFGTILAHTFFMFKFVVKICLTISLSIFKCSTLILMPKWQPVLTRVLTFFRLSSVFSITRQPSHSSSSHPLFLLKIYSVTLTQELLMRCLLHTPHVMNGMFQWQFFMKNLSCCSIFSSRMIAEN